jgi:putative RNA 2'-phosphotransferase
MTSKEMKRLAKSLAYIFCHRPDEYGLFLDDDGSVPIKELLWALGEVDGMRRLRESSLSDLIVIGGYSEFRIEGKKLFYEPGEGADLRVPAGPVEPPKMLYYGARRKNYPVLIEQGIRPGARRFEPFSPSEETAVFLAKRRDPEPIVVEVRAQAAAEVGDSQFYLSGKGLYLSEFVSEDYLFGPAPPKPRPKKETRPGKEPRPDGPPTPGSFVFDDRNDADSRARKRRPDRDKKLARREQKKREKKRKKDRREQRRRKEF